MTMIRSLRANLAAGLTVGLTRAVGLAALCLLAMPAVAAAGVAGTAERPTRTPPPVLDVTITAAGFEIPGANPRPSGLTTFRVSTPEPKGMWLALLRPKPDSTWERVIKAFDDSASPDPAVALQGVRDQYRYADFAGGVAVFPGRPVSFTERLTPGRYYLVGTSQQGGAHLQTLDVGEDRVEATPPRIDGIIRIVGTDRPRFVMPSRLPANGTFLVINDSSIPQEAVFARTVPGATFSTVQNYFDAQREGRPLPPNPLVATVAGMLAISPGRSAIVHADFEPGRYSVLSFLMEPENGVKQAYLGLHREFDFLVK
ncbi:hypothetical protein ACQPYK_13210 [Streptosporangium sp. CA-135522]|uniref:hypothetical protein n=1 Tax=Streptosporangium sp. CA-135522 TaxID=3240072 RepID=UPI003D8A3D33